jgi:hypothetical protein
MGNAVATRLPDGVQLAPIISRYPCRPRQDAAVVRV